MVFALHQPTGEAASGDVSQADVAWHSAEERDTVAAMRAGVISAPAARTNAGSERLRVVTAIDKYLDFIEHHRSRRTYLTYRYTLSTLLRDSLGTMALQEVSRNDILKFMTDCYKLGLGNRTVCDKLVVVLQMFKRFGKAKLIEPSDWPDYVEKIRPIYSPEEIRTMLKHAEDDEGIFLKFLLGSGFRDQETQYVTWRDLDCHNSLVRITAKPLFGFKPKNWEERAGHYRRRSLSSCAH